MNEKNFGIVIHCDKQISTQNRRATIPYNTGSDTDPTAYILQDLKITNDMYLASGLNLIKQNNYWFKRLKYRNR